MPLGYAQDITKVELIFKKTIKQVNASPVPRMARLHHGIEVDLQNEKKVHCAFRSKVLVGMAIHMNQYYSTLQPYLACKPIFKAHRRLGQPNLCALAHLCITIISCGPPNLHAVAH